MQFDDLSERDRTVIYECLRCVASGNVIEHDAEFPALLGIEVSELVSVLQAWPDVDVSDPVVACAINNSMLNLVDYPHGHRDTWSRVMTIPLDEIADVLARWRSIDGAS